MRRSTSRGRGVGMRRVGGVESTIPGQRRAYQSGAANIRSEQSRAEQLKAE